MMISRIAEIELNEDEPLHVTNRWNARGRGLLLSVELLERLSPPHLTTIVVGRYSNQFNEEQRLKIRRIIF